MSKQKKLSAWLLTRGATPAESIIYRIASDIYQKTGEPFVNSDIAGVFKSPDTGKTTHRTNIRVHLANMVEKGMIRRHRKKFYLPAGV